MAPKAPLSSRLRALFAGIALKGCSNNKGYNMRRLRKVLRSHIASERFVAKFAQIASYVAAGGFLFRGRGLA